MVASAALGAAQAAFDYSVDYAQERKQFANKYHSFRLFNSCFEMAMNIEAARLLIHKAGYYAIRAKQYQARIIC